MTYLKKSDLFVGHAEVYNSAGALLQEECYKLSAQRINLGDGAYRFVETKTYPDGRVFEVPFVLTNQIGPFDYSDTYKVLRGVYLRKGLCIGFQKYEHFEGQFYCSFDETHVETITLTNDRTIFERLEQKSPAL